MTYQPDTKSHLNPNPNHSHTTKQQAVVSIQQNTVIRPTYPEKFIRDDVVAPSVLLSVVIVTLPYRANRNVFNRQLETASMAFGL